MRPGPDCGFTGSVAVPPYTAENRAAHGCVVTTEVCRVCGAERRVNVNQLHEEYGPWGLCRAARERAARTAQAEADQAAMDRAGIRVVAVRRDAQGCVREILIERAAAIGGRTHAWHAWHEVAAAAETVAVR
jgi:hypothetical protein